MLTYQDLLSPNIWVARENYVNYGIALLETQVMSESERKRTIKDIKDIPEEEWFKRDAIGSQGDHALFSLLDRDGVDKYAPFVSAAYTKLQKTVSMIVGKDVLKSPHHQSSINIRRYMEGETEGKHKDTQPISCLWFLTDGGAPLVIETFKQKIEIVPSSHVVCVFQGRYCTHHVPAGIVGQYRLTVPYNFYVEGDTERPEYIDKMCYQNMSYADATSQKIS